VQLLGTLDGMEPVVKQISGYHGSPRFPGIAGSRGPGAGKDVSDALDCIRRH